jgi:tripartite-type tricarboxylate transporter receptor subunit TctC
MVVPSTPGSSADILGRILGDSMGAQLGQRFVVLNKAGGSGILGTAEVARAKPDGYTLMHGAAFSVTVQPLTERQTNYTADSFEPICQTFKNDQVIVVRPDSPLKSVRDLIAAAKAKPGALNVGTINPGSTQHLSAELFKTLAGINVTMIPYKTTPELVTGVLRGEIDVAFEYQAALQGSLDDRQIVAVATTGREPASSLPQAPTVAASLPGYEVTSWNGLAAPAGTPTEIVTLLNKGVTEVLALPEIKAATAKFGMEARGSSSADLEARIKSDIDRWAKVIETAGIEKK